MAMSKSPTFRNYIEQTTIAVMYLLVGFYTQNKQSHQIDFFRIQLG